MISPVRVLLLQADSSEELQDWTEVLSNAITYALHNQPMFPDRDLDSCFDGGSLERTASVGTGFDMMQRKGSPKPV